jgi:hypothetical protein
MDWLMVLDRFGSERARFAESDSGSQSGAKGNGEFLEFDAEACVGFQSGRRVSVD